MDKKKKSYLIFGIVFFVVYLIGIFLLIHIDLVKYEDPALSFSDSLSKGFKDVLEQPFEIIPMAPGTLTKIVLATTIIAFVLLVTIYSTINKKHYDNDTAQGDAKWLEDKDFVEYNKKFTEPFGSKKNDGKNNMILAGKMFMSMDNKGIADHNNHNGRNMNVFAIGGSGAGKSFGLVGPNILQANCSYIITDPSGGLFQDYGWFLENNGYRVKCFNLDHMEKSNHYNPFNYIHSDKDVEVLVTTLIANTNPPEKTGGDPFWEKSETALLHALIAYLFHYHEKKYQNFSNVMTLLRAAEINENDDSMQSPLDLMFEQAEEIDPEGFAIKQYKIFKMGAGKTLKSILISCAVRLQAFDLRDVADLTDSDDIDLDSVGDEKTALFVIIPTGEKTFNFLASMMYSQLFQRLYGYCENTSKFSQLVVDGDGELIRTFRADDPEESFKAADKAQKFLERAQTAEIKHDEKTGLYYVYSKDNRILRYSNTQEKANEFLRLLKHGKVVQNKGNRLPIHVRFLLDEFANTGKIPDFQEKVATMRKYEISVTIILQSLQQMKNLYEKEWEAISGNCDNTIYLGGGADTVTTEWMSKLLGKETRAIQGMSFNSGMSGGGNMSINRQGVELFAPAQLRTMDESECIVLQKSLHAYKGKKYPATNHKNWKYVEDTPFYIFDGPRQTFLYDEYKKAGDFSANANITKLDVIKETDEEKELRQRRNEDEKIKAAEFEKNEDVAGNIIINPPLEISTNDDIFANDILCADSVEDIAEITETLIESNDISICEIKFESQERMSFV